MNEIIEVNQISVTSVKLDDTAEPDDNTDLNAGTDKHGLLPKLGGGTTDYLRADGTWAAPSARKTIETGDWVSSGNRYYYAWTHSLNKTSINVQCKFSATNKHFQPDDIVETSDNVVTIWMDTNAYEVKAIATG